MSSIVNPTILLILDGWGAAEIGVGNAIRLSSTPNFNYLWEHSIHGYLQASGEYVGLPKGVMGNSEVGHLSIGAGKIVQQEVNRINQAIDNGSFFSNYILEQALDHSVKFNSNLHIMGLLSDGQVHSSIDHLFALLKLYAQKGATNVHLHLFADGRDAKQESFEQYYNLLNNLMISLKIGRVETVVGRYFAMDRDKRWDRTQKAYDLLVYGKGKKFEDINSMLSYFYSNNITDEFFEPAVIGLEDNVHISSNDAVVFFNYREDRALQLSQAFVNDSFDNFKRGEKLENIYFVGMTQYNQQLPINVAFPMESIDMPLGKVISNEHLLQYRVAETEKYAHITYFFNGGREIVLPGEERLLIDSPKVSTYDLAPKMKCYQITDSIIGAIKADKYRFILANFANADMLGHTGKVSPTRIAVEAIDDNIGRIKSLLEEYNCNFIITADHGNAEEMINYTTQSVNKEHTTNPVPFIFYNKSESAKDIGFGKLADIAPTILTIMGITVPQEMTGDNLLANI